MGSTTTLHRRDGTTRVVPDLETTRQELAGHEDLIPPNVDPVDAPEAYEMLVDAVPVWKRQWGEESAVSAGAPQPTETVDALVLAGTP